MKSLAISTLLLFISTITFSQNNKNDSWEWAPIGAVWMYKTKQMIFDSPPYNSLEQYWFVRSEKDTTIQGQNCRKLTVERFSPPYITGTIETSRYGYMYNGVVYLYNYYGEFQPVYNYNVNPGDTITLYSPLFSENCFSTYIVDSITEREAGEWTNDLPHFQSNIAIQEYQLSRISGNCWSFNVNHPSIGEYLTYSGSTYDEMCPSTETIEEVKPKFSCYYDGNVTIYNTNYNAIDSCISYYNAHSLNIETPTEKGISIYPNLTSDKVNINTNNSTTKLHVDIYNTSGFIISHNSFENTTTISLKALKPSFYFIHVYNEDSLFREKVIKL